MAEQEKMKTTGSELDNLIHMLEFENQHYVKMIEKENQRNTYLESQEEEKTKLITELQAHISTLEMETKNNHKQLVHNKNIVESLKKTKVVLQAHVEALHKQLDMLQFENEEQQREFADTLQMYENTWKDYEAKYKSLPLYKTLMETKAKLTKSEEERIKWQKQKNELQCRAQAAQDELDFKDWQRFCVRIAEKKLKIARQKEELLAAVRDKETLQAKLEAIRDKTVSAAAITPLLTTQYMDTDEGIEEAVETDSNEQPEMEQDTTLTGGDGGDTSQTVTQKEDFSDDADVITEEHDLGNYSAQQRTCISNYAPDSRIPAVFPLSLARTEITQELREKETLVITQEFRYGVPSEPLKSSTSVVFGAKSKVEKLSQLTSTPKMPQRPPAVFTPRMSAGKEHRPGLRSTSPNKVKPQKLQIPLITVSMPLPVRLASIPTVQSAVSTLLSGTKCATGSKIRPAMPKIPVLRVPLMAPPTTLPLLKLPHLNETGKTGLDVPKVGVSVTTTAATRVKLPLSLTARGQDHNSVSKPMFLDSPPAVVPMFTCGSQSSQQVNNSCGLPLPVMADSGAGDAPPLPETGGPQLTSTPEDKSRFSQDAFSQGLDSNAFSPFDMQKHQQRLLEINQSEDSFNPFDENDNSRFQKSLFSNNRNDISRDQTDVVKIATSSRSVFGFGLITPSEEPVVSHFSKAASPISSTVITKSSSPNRDERGGSFFSFETMDTSEDAGNSVLSLFGKSSRKPELESTFSLNFGTSTTNSARDSGFSFSFGGGTEESSSIFSLF